MERTGIEPVTSGLQSREGLDDVGRRPATSEAQSHKPCGIAGSSTAWQAERGHAGGAMFWRFSGVEEDSARVDMSPPPPGHLALPLLGT
jgi:hypothetical protein